MKEKHLMCVNNNFPVIITSYENACTAIKLLFHVCGTKGKQKEQKQECQVHLVVQTAHQTM